MERDAREPPLFTPIEDRRVFKEILLQLEEAITAGHLGPGDRLPSERDLAQQFAVSRTSVREALRVLEALGVLRVRPGADHGATLVDGPTNALRDILQFQLALRHISIASLIEFRLVIEAWAARAAALRNGADADFVELRRLDAETNLPGIERTAFLTLDASFHLEIARLSGNELLALVLEGARSSTERVMREVITSGGTWASTRKRLLGEHAKILAAITDGDGDAASRHVVDHIETAYRDLLRPDVAGSTTPLLRFETP
jgi:GntR family transcriptional regulator, transcriptional repressor for pyruvate dehydrogenase complex